MAMKEKKAWKANMAWKAKMAKKAKYVFSFNVRPEIQIFFSE